MPYRNEAALEQLVALLRESGPMTAKEIATETASCKPIVYRRLRELAARGRLVTTCVDEPGKTGPKPIRYGLR